MSEILIILLAGIFLPLFPLSMLFNAIIDKVENGIARVVLFIIWPLIGLSIVVNSDVVLPSWLLSLVLFTSVLYAIRMLSLRELVQWTGFLATSLWSLLWLPIIQGGSGNLVYGLALGMSAPLVLLVLLSAGLEKRFGAAFTDLYGGLARTIPRFAGVFVTVVVAAIATPLFPTFFIMLDLVVETISTQPLATVALLLIWLLWSWAGARLMQGLIVGRASEHKIPDLSALATSFYGAALIVLLSGGVYLSGVIL